ncbi:MAG: sigma factor-like helix-turn-helix DNA-binding protein, partial [bacterium]
CRRGRRLCDISRVLPACHLNNPICYGPLQSDDVKSRDRAIRKAYVEHAYTQREIAAHLGISYVTVSRIIKEIKC